MLTEHEVQLVYLMEDITQGGCQRQGLDRENTSFKKVSDPPSFSSLWPRTEPPNNVQTVLLSPHLPTW